MHEILATAMVLGACKDRGGQILPNLMFRIHKRHISGIIPGKTIYLLRNSIGKSCVIYLPCAPEICRFDVQNVKLGKIRPRYFNGLEKT